MKPRSVAAVLFDLDGTLLDSAPDLMAAMNRLLAGLHRKPVDPLAFSASVSKGSRAMLAIAFPDLDIAEHERMLPEFLELYRADIATHSRAYPGIPEFLSHLQTRGIPWAIVTNKPEALARAVLAAMSWSIGCATLVGGDTLPVKKPDPEPLRLACRTMAVDPVDCVYVGDDLRDIVAARSCGMRSVVALWGYRDPVDDPNDWRADAMAESPGDLLRAAQLAATPA